MSWTPRGTPFSATDTTSTLALSLSSTRAPTAGDLMLVCVGIRNSDTAVISSVADDQGGSWTRLIRHATAGQFVEQWSGVAAASASTVITITFDAAVQSNGVAQAIGSSVGSWFKQDEATGATAAGTTHTPGTVDAESGDLLSTMTSVATAYTLGTLATDYDQIGSMSRAICQRQIAAGTISPDGAWTTTAAEDTVSTHVVLREGTGGGLSTTSTVATASWVTPAATASIPGSATSTAASATWTSPSSSASPGAVTSASTSSTARWVAREGTSSPGAVTTTSTVATATWTAPAATAAPGAVSTSSTVATATWTAPAATANLTGQATSTAASATWTAPAATAAPGAIGTSSTVTSAAWTTPTSAATTGGSGTTSTAASAAWTVPASAAAVGAVTTTATASVTTWTTVTATALTDGAAVSVAASVLWTTPLSAATNDRVHLMPVRRTVRVPAKPYARVPRGSRANAR